MSSISSKRRAACNSVVDQLSIVENLYDKRSRYVHAGEAPSLGDLQHTDAICKRVLSCLLRLNRFPEDHERNFVRNKWFKNLDYTGSALLANMYVSDETLTANGTSTAPGWRNYGSRKRFYSAVHAYRCGNALTLEYR